jgi:ABC-type nitrate/sulfonate/bicarbonate transport system permease component
MTTVERLPLVRNADRRSGRRLGRAFLRRLPLLLLPLVGIFVWQAVETLADPRSWLLPSPLEVAQALVDQHGRLWFHAVGTLQGALAGFACAVIAGAALAVAISGSRAVGRAVYPWAIASQAVPILAVAPVLALWLGYGPGRLAVAALVAFFPVVVTGVDGLRGADPQIARSLRTLGAGPRWVWRHATLPAALPAFFSGLKMAAVFSVTGAVVAEYVAADRGLAYLSRIAYAQFQADVLFAAVVWLAAMGIAFFALVAGVERLALPHRHRSTRPRWRLR